MDYLVVNEALEDRTFRMDQLTDLAPVLKHADSLFRAYLSEFNYHLRFRFTDQRILEFTVGYSVRLYPTLPQLLIKVALCFFTKVLRSAVHHLRRLVLLVFSSLEEVFSLALPTAQTPATPADKNFV